MKNIFLIKVNASDNEDYEQGIVSFNIKAFKKQESANEFSNDLKIKLNKINEYRKKCNEDEKPLFDKAFEKKLYRNIERWNKEDQDKYYEIENKFFNFCKNLGFKKNNKMVQFISKPFVDFEIEIENIEMI